MRHTLPMIVVGSMTLAALAGCARPLPTSPDAGLGGQSFVLSGVVVAGDPANPIEGVEVRVTPIGADPADAAQNRTIQTDAAGAFRATDLAAGSWTVTLTKSGYKGRSMDVSLTRDISLDLSLLPLAAVAR